MEIVVLKLHGLCPADCPGLVKIPRSLVLGYRRREEWVREREWVVKEGGEREGMGGERGWRERENEGAERGIMTGGERGKGW